MIHIESTINMIPVPAYMKIPAVEIHFGYKRKKTLSLLKKGLIRGKRHGRDWVVSTASIAKFLNK